MSERTDSLTRRAADERKHLTDVFDALEAEVDELTDWRAYVRREPMTALAIVAVSGALIGVASAPRQRSSATPGGLSRGLPGTDGIRNAASAAMLRHVGTLLLDVLAARALSKYGSTRRSRRDAINRRRTREAPARDS